MFINYRTINTKDRPITTISTGLYLINICRASYLDIQKPQKSNQCNLNNNYTRILLWKITEDLAKYNKKLSDPYISKLDGIIVKIFYRGSQQSQLEKSMNRKPVEISPAHNLKSEVEIITNNMNLYQLINYRRPIGMIIKVPIF